MATLFRSRGVLNLWNFRVISPIVANKSACLKTIHSSSVRATERKFTKDHEWIVMSNDVGTVGISDHAQKLLGDIVYVELPEVGHVIDQSDIFGVVESVKAASDLYAPVTGEITEVNEALNASPDLVNKEPYAGGWIAKMKLTDLSQLDELMDESSYLQYVKESEDE